MAEEWMASLKRSHLEMASFTLGGLEGFLYLAEEFALTLIQKCVQCLCWDGLVSLCGGVAHQDVISIAVGAVVTASGENVEQTAWSGDK